MGNGSLVSMNTPDGKVDDFNEIMEHLCEDTEREIKFYRQIASEYKSLLTSVEKMLIIRRNLLLFKIPLKSC